MELHHRGCHYSHNGCVISAQALNAGLRGKGTFHTGGSAVGKRGRSTAAAAGALGKPGRLAGRAWPRNAAAIPSRSLGFGGGLVGADQVQVDPVR